MSYRPSAPSLPSSATAVPLIDLARVIASQLIVWHHLTRYSPLQDALDPLAPALWDWLADPARMVVQVFLVMAGYLAARQWLPRPGCPAQLQPSELPRALGHRILRLLPACAVAIGAAVFSAAVARCFSDDPSIPEAPSWMQLAANLLLLQDIVGQEALTAGIWYVAIDIQLFAIVLLILALRPHRRGRLGLTMALVGGLTAASLFHFNLDSELDAWAWYFFGAYGMGILAAWTHQAPRPWQRDVGLVILGLMLSGGLMWQWRDRLLLAGLTALCLASPLNSPQWRCLAQWPIVRWLSRISYALFLVHYPVCVLMGAAFDTLWPGSTAFSALGMLSTWAVSLLAAWALHLGVEQRVRQWLRGAPTVPGLWHSAPR